MTREIRIEGDLAFVPLTKGYEAVIDICDIPNVSGVKWYVMAYKSTSYAGREVNGKTIRLHRVITNAPDGVCVDHINRNGLDNRRQNLRLVTHAQNMKNCGLSSANSSGIKGVSWRSAAKKWVAQISVENKVRFLGYFDDKEQARIAYNTASLEFHGEFAVHP